MTPTRTTLPTTIPTTFTTMTPSTTNDVTQIVMNTTSCVCICREVNQTVEERTENRRRELIVNQKGLTSTTRKRTSAPDIRVTSKVIATVVAIIGLVVYGLVFFLGDIFSVFNFIYTEILIKKATVEPV